MNSVHFLHRGGATTNGRRGGNCVAAWMTLTKHKQMEEYLTIKELAERLKVSPKTIKNKMALGIFHKGRHYFSRQGLGPRFKWSAVVDWLEGKEESEQENLDSIPMARGYKMGSVQ